MISKAFKKAYLPKCAEQFERPDIAQFFRFLLAMNTSLERLRSNFCGVVELLNISHHIGRALSKDPIVSSTITEYSWSFQGLRNYARSAQVVP
jgi:hypothetical protein